MNAQNITLTELLDLKAKAKIALLQENEEYAKKLQQVLLDNGYIWSSGKKTISYDALSKAALVLSPGKELTYYTYFSPDYVEYKQYKLILPHRHYALIHQWAENPSIEVERKPKGKEKWLKVVIPFWYEDQDYRIKPKQTKTTLYSIIWSSPGNETYQGDYNSTLRCMDSFSHKGIYGIRKEFYLNNKLCGLQTLTVEEFLNEKEN